MADVKELKARRAIREAGDAFGHALMWIVMNEIGRDIRTLPETDSHELFSAMSKLAFVMKAQKERAGTPERQAEIWVAGFREGQLRWLGEAVQADG